MRYSIATLLTVSVLAYGAQSRFLDASNYAVVPSIYYATTLNCGQCLLGGWTYCIKAAEGTATPPEQYCC